jgi:hypothetical protein
VTDGHEAEAIAELVRYKQWRIGKLLRELVGWPVASKRLKSVVESREARHIGPSHLHARPHQGEERSSS